MVLGVDVGGTKIAVAAVNGVTATHAVEHPTVLVSADALLDGMEHAVRDVIAAAGQPEAIGVGVPSQIEYSTGTVESRCARSWAAASGCRYSSTTTRTAPR